jgi:dihydroorotate dehydrogenase (NAD+) catalytic subunit
MEPNTNAIIGKLTFENPVLLASGPLSSNEQSILRASKKGFGGIVTKTVTREPCEGNPRPRWAFQESCLVSADGLPNPGYKKMSEYVRRAKAIEPKILIIASIAGTSPEEYAEMAGEFEKEGADAIELNMVCPHMGRLVGKPGDAPVGQYWSQSAERAFSVIKTVKKEVGIPVWAKFASQRPLEVVLAMVEAGVDALVPFPGGIPGMVIDVETGRPVLGNVEGSGTITGRAIKPFGVKVVSELCRQVEVPVIGTGGIASEADVLEYIMAGACAVQMLTETMRKRPVMDIAAGLRTFMTRKNFKSLDEIRGLALNYLPLRK